MPVAVAHASDPKERPLVTDLRTRANPRSDSGVCSHSRQYACRAAVRPISSQLGAGGAGRPSGPARGAEWLDHESSARAATIAVCIGLASMYRRVRPVPRSSIDGKREQCKTRTDGKGRSLGRGRSGRPCVT